MISREPVAGPPKGYRPAIPVKIKLEVVLRQGGVDPSTGDRLQPLGEGVQFDHNPALQLRAWDEEAGDTIPPANSVEHLVAMNKSSHERKTNGTKATSAGSDKHAIAKINRLTGKTKGRPKTNWPSRPLKSRNTFKG